MDKKVVNKIGNLDEYESFEEISIISENIRITNELRKKGFKLENKFLGFKAS